MVEAEAQETRTAQEPTILLQEVAAAIQLAHFMLQLDLISMLPLGKEDVDRAAISTHGGVA